MDLISCYSQLAAEAKRRDSAVREASEASILALQQSSATALQDLAHLTNDDATKNILLYPISLGCSSKNAKVVTLALNCLQRLLIASPTRPALGPAAISPVIQALRNVSNQGVESQLKILQVLPTLLSSASDHVHRDKLFDCLLLCFKLQDSKVGVVSSTAAATLRQMVIILFEGVVEEDRKAEDSQELHSLTLYPENTVVQLRPSALDAFDTLQDLCNLISNPPLPANHLQLANLPKTFGLELIESVLSDFPTLFYRSGHPELHHLLKHSLSPLLMRSLAGDTSSPPVFSVTLRLMRVIFLLLKGFSHELPTECEIFWQMFIRIITPGETEAGSSHPYSSVAGITPPATLSFGSLSPSIGLPSSSTTHVTSGAGPQWMRVLALEIIRGLCSDFNLLRQTFEKFDASSQDNNNEDKSDSRKGQSKTGVVVPLMNALSRLASEKPSLLGVGNQVMMGAASGGQDFSMSGMVDAALGGSQASAADTEFSIETSGIKLQCIDQLDKADAPPLPDTYLYLLALQCLSAVAVGFHNSAQPAFSAYATQRCVDDSSLSPAAPPAFQPELAKEAESADLASMRAMAEAVWPSLLYSLSFFISTALSDTLFIQVLSAFQYFTATCGMLNLRTPRDALIASLCKFALPSVVMASINASPSASTAPNPESTSFTSKASTAAAGVLATGADALGFTSSNQSGGPVLSLSSRNLQCLGTLLQLSDQLAGMLGDTWYAVCEAVTNCEYALRVRASAKKKPEETEALSSITRLFEGTSASLDDLSFKAFIQALSKLSCEMIGLPFVEDNQPVSSIPVAVRKRAGTVGQAKMLRANDKSLILSRLGDVAVLNIHRLLYRDPEVAWQVVVSHLLSVQHWPPASASLRVQAAQTLDKIVDSASSTLLKANKEHQAEIQSRLIQALSIQATDATAVLETASTSTDMEIRRRAYETLFKLLESNGHSLLCGWTDIFNILKGVCPLDQSAPASNRTAALIAASFPSAQLIASDFLSALDTDELKLCIETLAAFARQGDDVNIALTAGGLLWQVSDHLQRTKKSIEDAEASRTYNELWLGLLHRLLFISEDQRYEVRNGAVQILFRCLESYGALLATEDWDKCLWDVVQPLFNRLSDQENLKAATKQNSNDPTYDPAKQVDESRILILGSIGSLVAEFLASKITATSRYIAFWESLTSQLRRTFLEDRSNVATNSMQQFEKITNAALALSAPQSENTELRTQILTVSWQTWSSIGAEIQRRAGETAREEELTQPSLEAFVRALQPLQSWDEVSSDVGRSKDILQTLKSIITWNKSPDYRPDIDSITPTQVAVLEAVQRLNQSNPDIAAASLADLAEYSTLPYLSAFEIQPVMPFTSRKLPVQRITYIAFTKAVMPKAASLFLQNQSSVELYTSGAVEQLLKAHEVPLKLKYECPPASKYGSDPPLWQTATIQLLRLARACVQELSSLELDRPVFESLWRQVVACYSSAILADSSSIIHMTPEQRCRAEDFDLSVLASLELDILPQLATQDVPEQTIQALARSIQLASKQYDMDVPGVKLNKNDAKIAEIKQQEPRFSADFHVQATQPLQGTTAGVLPSPRERFGFWAFDFLFQMCQASNETKDLEGKRRLAGLFLPFLLDRCVACMKTYLADAAIRGKMPFQRIRDEELHYVIEKLLRLKLYEGCFATAIAVDAPNRTPLQSALMESEAAHLFRVMPLLTALLALPSISKSVASAPFRKTEAAKKVTGLIEGVVLAQVGRTSGDTGEEEEAVSTAELLRRCLDRTASIVAI